MHIADNFLLLLELVLIWWSFLLCLDYLFVLFPALGAPELLSFDFLVSELLFVLLGFTFPARMNTLLAFVYVCKSMYLVLFVL